MLLTTLSSPSHPLFLCRDNDDEDLDMSREKERTFKVVAFDVATRLASGLVSFATGYIIQVRKKAPHYL
jgi:hypothetical protein